MKTFSVDKNNKMQLAKAIILKIYENVSSHHIAVVTFPKTLKKETFKRRFEKQNSSGKDLYKRQIRDITQRAGLFLIFEKKVQSDDS
jgi:hypothetical protein